MYGYFTELLSNMLKFTAGGATMDGALEIVGTGKGSFHIGAVSLMPAGNIGGFRADIIGVWKEIGPTILRWPGGNFTSGYDWRDGIGEPSRSTNGPSALPERFPAWRKRPPRRADEAPALPCSRRSRPAKQCRKCSATPGTS